MKQILSTKKIGYTVVLSLYALLAIGCFILYRYGQENAFVKTEHGTYILKKYKDDPQCNGETIVADYCAGYGRKDFRR